MHFFLPMMNKPEDKKDRQGTSYKYLYATWVTLKKDEDFFTFLTAALGAMSYQILVACNAHTQHTNTWWILSIIIQTENIQVSWICFVNMNFFLGRGCCTFPLKRLSKEISNS